MTEEMTDNNSRIFGMPNILWEIKKTSLKRGLSKELHLFGTLCKLQFNKLSVMSPKGNVKTSAVVYLTFIKASVNNQTFRFNLICGWLNKYGEESFVQPSRYLNFSDFIGKKIKVWKNDYASFINSMENDSLYFFCRLIFESQSLIEKIDEQIVPPSVNNLAEDLKILFDQSTMTDVILKCGDEKIPAHKCILSCRSPVFRAMFQNDFKESLQGIVDIVDTEPTVFRKLITYVYTENLDTENESFESICNLFKAAHKYCIETLKDRCALFLRENLEPQHACDVLFISELYGHLTLKTYVISYIIQRKEFLQSEDWERFAKDHLALANEVFFHYVRKSV